MFRLVSSGYIDNYFILVHSNKKGDDFLNIVGFLDSLPEGTFSIKSSLAKLQGEKAKIKARRKMDGKTEQSWT